MQETPSQNPLQEKLHYYFIGKGFTKLMSELEIDPKSLKPGQTVHQAQQEKIHAFVQEILEDMAPDWNWESGKNLLLHFELPQDPAELENEILNLILILEDSLHPLTKAYDQVEIKDYDSFMVKNYQEATKKVRRQILRLIQGLQQEGKTYEIGTLLGEGGLGKVYDTEGAHQQRLKIGNHELVAKFSKQNAINPVAQNNPAFMEATQEDPHLVAYYGSLEKQSQGEEWTSMVDFLEYVEGEPLEKLMKEEKYQNYDEVLADIVLPITYALESLHQAQFVHLDIKPGNILVGKDGSVKLGDYDLVTRIGTRIAGGSGTPGFLSPEQKTGKSRIITEKSDVYALGKLLATIVTDQTEGPALVDIEEPELRQLIQDSIRIRAELRPTLQEFRERLVQYLKNEGLEFEEV